jgi:hypothetical protein
MPLGSDNTICAKEFVDAMRARLNTLSPPAGGNVDDPSVHANLAALGQSVFRILSVEAQTFSNASSDPAFWVWMAAVNTWLGKLSTWQAGVAAAFNAWAPATTPDQTLKAALVGVAAPGVPPAPAPSSLTGVVR